MKLTKLISEQYNSKLKRLHENILTDMMTLILTPRLKKAIKSLKDDPEFKELEQQIKKSKEAIDAITKRLERNLDKRNKIVQDMKKAGIKVDTNMDSTQMFNAYKDWSADIDKSIKSRGAKSTWEKYFNK